MSELRFYLSRFWRRAHWFALCALLGTGGGLALALGLPTSYRADALLVVEAEQIPGDLAAPTVRSDAGAQLQIIQQRILTRETLLEMANRLAIYEGEGRLGADEIVEDLRERIGIETTGSAGNSPEDTATLVGVSFEAETADLAARVANEVVTLILSENVEMRTNVARQTLEFFEREVARLDEALAAQGAKVLAFKEAHHEALPDSLDFRRSQQAAGQARLLNLEREEAALRERRAQLERLQSAPGGAGALLPDTPEGRALAALQEELASALLLLSPEHPRIKMLQAKVAAQEQRLAAETGAAGGAALSAYEVQLADLEGQLAFIARERATIGTEMAALAASIAETPANAITLETLERDYANIRAQYDQAVSSKARAETGDMIEALAKGQRIAVIEQAVAPEEPDWPNRPLIAVAGVLFGLMAGVGLILALELMKGAVRRPEDMARGLNILPLVTLPYIATQAELRRRRIWRIAGLAALVLAPLLALWAVQTFYLPLDLIWDQAVRRISQGALPMALAIG